ncbi:hypothetical protein DFH29DRAFT_543634 [Suillus ampliporus]|nr:hypothetical protein DFH29DRAFT_543634 [Suillus ampliporus]
MSCTPSATATEYATITTYTTSTSFSQSVASDQATVTTVVQQTCIATGTLSGSNNTGCVSSAAVTQVNTIGGGGSTTQVPVVVTVSVTETQPTKTLYATCSDGSTQSQSQTTPSTTSETTSSSTPSPVTTSVLVVSTPSPTIITQEFSTTLSNGVVVPTVITTTSTPPPSSVYSPSVISSPTVTGTQSGSGTDVAPIVGGVVGGFVGLIAIVSALWYLCRKRRSWDDIFEREALRDEESDSPIAVRRERDRNRLDLGAEPKPYQYGLVGHIKAPPGSGSLSGTEGDHSRNTSISPLLGTGAAPEKASRPSATGSLQAVQTPAAQRQSAASQSSSMGPRSLSMVSTSSSAPLIDASASLASSSRVDELGQFDPLNRTGSPTPVIDRRVLQIINDDPQSPKSDVVPSAVASARLPGKSAPKRRRSSVVVHTDAGQVSANLGGTSNEPPPYSRE